MAKHAVPKKKKGSSKSRQVYGSFKTKVLKKLSGAVNLTKCPDCGAMRMAHTVCHECGKYRGRQVLNKQKQVEKITKIKA